MLIITRRQKNTLIEALFLPTMLTMIRSQFIEPDYAGLAEQHFHYPDDEYGKEQAIRHWDSLAAQLREEVRRSNVSCRIDSRTHPNQVEYIYGPDTNPPIRVINIGDCHIVEEIPF